MSPILYIIIPCYNEEEVLPLTSGMFLEELELLAGAGRSPSSWSDIPREVIWPSTRQRPAGRRYAPRSPGFLTRTVRASGAE